MGICLEMVGWRLWDDAGTWLIFLSVLECRFVRAIG
jgi:hypothetical protein